MYLEVFSISYEEMSTLNLNLVLKVLGFLPIKIFEIYIKTQ